MNRARSHVNALYKVSTGYLCTDLDSAPFVSHLWQTMSSAPLTASTARPFRSDRDPVGRAMARALQRLDNVPDAAQPMADAIRALCLRGGKRVRPRLCVLGYEGVTRTAAPTGVYTFAAGVELLHAFMLVHDDLIDGAEVRRGGPSVHRMLGQAHAGTPSRSVEHLGMLAGDLLFATSVDTMLSARLPATRLRTAVQRVLSAANDAAVGEYLDVLFERRPIEACTSADLADVLRLKTAGYTFEAPLCSGALLAGASEVTCEALSAFGTRVGVAYQLVDDLIDLFGDAATTGKPAGGDVRQGKRTVLVRLALERAGSSDARILRDALDARDAVTPEQIVDVIDAVRRTGAGASVSERVRSLVRAGCHALGRGRELSPGARAALRTLAAEVVSQMNTLEARWS